MKKKLLIIEDEKSLAKQIKWSLEKHYNIAIALESSKALNMLISEAFPVALLDLGLPPCPDSPKEGFKILETLQRENIHTKLIVITGHAEEEYALKAIELGGYDFCAKPVDLNILKIILERAFRLYDLEEMNRKLLTVNVSGGSFQGMLGSSKVMQRLFSQIKKISDTEYPVLITGASGTGKENVAKAIYQLSPRQGRPFIIINCAAIPENLLESELFGHEKGAFTGATTRKIGKFELANNGTCFLDEVGELSMSLQVKLLRMLQEYTIERVGGTEIIQLDVRIIAATNSDLSEAIENGRFREDLYYRLNVVPIELPLLKDRGEDIILLAYNFLKEETDKMEVGPMSLSPSAVAALASYSWPGNVRELQNRIRRAISNASDQVILPKDLGLEKDVAEKEKDKFYTLKKARENAEKKAVSNALSLTDGNITKAAKLLETSRPTLHDLIKKYGL